MATEDDLHAWTAASGRDWNQLCQALMWNYSDQFGTVVSTPPSAIDAYYASDIQSYDAASAPPGSYIYWDIGAYGHVAQSVDTSNAMGSGHLQTVWGINAGLSLVDYYNSQTGATPLGWAWDNGGNTIDYGTGGGGGGGGAIDYAWGLTTACQSDLQYMMGQQGRTYYVGPVDGAFGENSVKGMQQWLKDLGYLPGDYGVDGIPGETYGTALQELAAEGGVPKYTGPLDGYPGEATSESLRGWANSLWGTDPDPGPDPDPPPSIPTTPAETVFGIDIGSSQAGIDLTEFADAGGAAVIVKMGGGNASDSPYVAPHYLDQIAAARATSLNIGHYWFNGRANGVTPTSAAAYFVANAQLMEGDLIALDVEDETDTGTTAYTPAEVLEFVSALDVHLPGVKVLIYMSAGLARSGEWDEVAALGHPLWVASWGSNDGTIPGSDPDLTGSAWEDWAVWQYSSVVKVPGWEETGLDANVIYEDTWARYGWVPEDPGPEPEPGTPDATTEVLRNFLFDLADLAEEAAAALPVPEVDTLSLRRPGRHRSGR